jgi:phage terminase large subunit
MTSAEISIIPEFWEKVEMLGLEGSFYKTQNSIINLESGSTILFRGIKSSSGKQTANLKSINNITTWVLDEAEEMTDEATFDRIDLSVRKKGEANEVILVLNPVDNKKHFIFRKFYDGYGLSNVFRGVKGNCTYIHTTYLDNIDNLSADFLALAEQCKKVDTDKYNNIYLGYFGEHSKGLIYKNWKRIKASDYPINLPSWYGVDWVFANDPTGVVRICYDNTLNRVYLYEVCYQKGMQPRDVAALIKQDYRGKKTLIYEGEVCIFVLNGMVWAGDKSYPLTDYIADNSILDWCGVDKAFYDKPIKNIYNVMTEIYCDPARPEHIGELRSAYNLSAVGAVNAKKEGRIEYLKYFEVFYCGDNIHNEVSNYMWLADKQDSKILTNTPQDKDDHLMDATSYGAVTHLRRIGAVNNLGEK